MTHIVFLDGFTTNPGDLDWKEFTSLGSFTVYPRTPVAEIVTRAQGAEVILTNKTPFDRATLSQLPALRCICVTATGYNVVDVDAARERGIIVCNVPGYSTPSVVQHTLALMLELTNHVGLHAQAVRDGAWQSSPDFAFWSAPLVELHGLTLGIVGFGTIGRGVAAVAHALGMRVLAAGRRLPADLPSWVEWTDRDSLFQRADIVTLHCPLTPETKGMIHAGSLAKMKSTAFLINTGRGPLVDEAALADALQSGRIAGAAMDVLSVEPPRSGSPLITAKNCLITPHQAWASKAARQRLLSECAANVRGFLTGAPRNVVNG